MKGLRERRLSGSIILCCLCIIILTRCITPYEPSGVANSGGLLVVEAYIIAPTGSSIKISRTNGLQDEGDYEKVSDAQISVINDRGEIVAIAIEGEMGEYRIIDPVEFVANTKYALDIKIGNENYRSSFEEPLITPQIDELNWVSKNGGYEVDILLSTSDPLQQTGYYLWRYEEDWEYTSRLHSPERWDPYRGLVLTTNRDNAYYCWDSDYSRSFILGDTKKLHEGRLRDKVILNIKADNIRFSYLYSILVKQYAVPYGAYKYYDNMYKNINESGGLFAPMPTEMDGNITNLTNPEESVIGYVLMSTETSKRIFIYGTEAPYMYRPHSGECEQEPIYPEDDVSSPRVAYAGGWGISNVRDDGTYEYRRLRCLDCRTKISSKNKPDFWPTDHM